MTRIHRPGRGQSVAEFALVLPVLVAILGGIIQFGMIFWAQNTLTQVVRDTGRWAATQQSSPCSAGASAVLGQAQSIATSSSLLGYPPATAWSLQAYPMTTATAEGVAVTWNDATPTPPGQTGDTCPPPNNAQVWFVTIQINHTVPVFFPGMQYLPGFANNRITLSSTAQFRMEPAP